NDNTVKPYIAYDYLVKADVQGTESSGVELDNVTPAFTGTAADWIPGAQDANGRSGNRIRLAWTDTDLYAGISNTSNNNLLHTGDSLWIAVDTDPAGADTSGEYKTTTVGANDVIWPFKANYVAELKILGPGSTAVNLRNVSTNSWAAASGAASF